jgi:hypothetical protein
MVFGEIADPFTPSRIAAAFAVVEDAPISLGVGGDIDRTFEFRLDLTSGPPDRSSFPFSSFAPKVCS